MTATATKPAPGIVTRIHPSCYELIRNGATVARAVRRWKVQGAGNSGWIVDGLAGLVPGEAEAVAALRAMS